MDEIRKSNIRNAKFRSDGAANNAQRLYDSAFVREQLTDQETENLKKCAIFLTRIARKFSTMYDDEEAWN